MHSFSWQRVGVASSLAAHAARVAVGLTAVAAASAHAANLDDVVVSATRSEQRLADVVADITVVDRDQLNQQAGRSLEDVMAKLPGVQITRNGGPGTDTTLYLRGASKQHTAVYIDGIRVDAQNGSGGAQWESLPVDLIDRIEVLRGPAGAVYGSDALAGVVQIFTKRGEDGVHPFMGVGAGTYGSRKEEAGLSGAHGLVDYALGVSYAKSKGFDSKTDGAHNEDRDGYTRKSANARVGLQLSRAHRLDLTALTSKSDAGYDATKSTQDDRAIRKLDAYGLTWAAQWTEGFRTNLSVSESTNRYQTTGTSFYEAETRLRTVLLQNEWKLGSGQLSLALERREDALENTGLKNTNRKERDQTGIAVGYGAKYGAHTVQLNARSDDDSDFGRKNTGGVGYGWDFAPQWRVTASASTGFRVPSLYQRFSAYGDPALAPEESRNKEVGLRWAHQGNHLGVTLYHNKLKNLVSYQKGLGSCGMSSCYVNVDRALLQGITIAGAYRTGMLKWYGSVDFQNPKNEETGKLLERRSRRFATLGVDAFIKEWTLGAEMQAASRRYNGKDDKVMTLGGYTLFNLSASRQIARDFTLTARLDNLMDKDYTLAKDYATAGRTFWVGLKWMPQ
jgi:vitamin B12 transporter